MKPGDGKLVVVTGASGFIGSHLCEYLLQRGYRVRGVYRSNRPSDSLSDQWREQWEPIQADLKKKADVLKVVRAGSTIIHAAALASDWGPYEKFEEINVKATQQLLAEAEHAGCECFVYISSAAVHGFGEHVSTNESGPYFALKYPYPKTKMEAEKLVLAGATPQMRTIAVRPANVYGPGDKTSTYTMFRQIEKGAMGFIGGGKTYTCPIYIDDLCAGVGAVMESKDLKSRVILLSDGDRVSWRDYVARMFELLNSKKKPLNLPVWLAYSVAYLLTWIYSILRIKRAPMLTLYRVEQAANNYHFDNSMALKMLNFKPKVAYREGLERTIQAYLTDKAKNTGSL